MKLYACDLRKTGSFGRGYDNTAHAGSYWYNVLNISCKNNIYNATLTCGGENEINKTAYDGRKYIDLKPYKHKANVEITIINNNFSLIIPEQTRKICGIHDNIKGIYRHFADSNELLPDGADITACEAFDRRQRP